MYVGQSQTGKTHLALAHAARSTDGLPFLIVDSMGARNFRSSPHRVALVSDAMGRVFDERRHAVVTPWSDDEGDLLFDAAADLGGVHIFIDESVRWLHGRTGETSTLARLLRAASHRDLTVTLTTQHFSGDAPAFLFNCEAEFFVFRTASARARKRLADEWEEPSLPDLVKNLADFVCIRRPL